MSEISEKSIATLNFNQPMIIFDQPFDAFMLDPLRFLKFEVEKNAGSRYWEDLAYIESGKVLSASVIQFTAQQI